MNAKIKARALVFWRAMLPWILLRLRQPTTYLGLVVKVGALFGLVVTDSAAGQIAELIAVAIGAGLVAYDQGAARRSDDSDKAGA